MSFDVFSGRFLSLYQVSRKFCSSELRAHGFGCVCVFMFGVVVVSCNYY